MHLNSRKCLRFSLSTQESTQSLLESKREAKNKQIKEGNTLVVLLGSQLLSALSAHSINDGLPVMVTLSSKSL